MSKARAAILGGAAVALAAASVGALTIHSGGHPTRPVAEQSNTGWEKQASASSHPLEAQDAASASGVLKPGQVLKSGGVLRSPNRQYMLEQQLDGNLVLYRGKTALWDSSTERHPGAYAVMQTDGNLVVVVTGKVLWASNTARHPGARLALQDDGNLVITLGRSVLWTRHLAIGALSPGIRLKSGDAVRSYNGRYTLVMQSDGNLVLYQGRAALWGSGTDRHPGAYALMQYDGNLVIYQGTRPIWQSNTPGHPGAQLQVQEDGNLVIYQGSTPLWSRYFFISTLPSGYNLKPGMAVQSHNRTFSLLMQSDGNLVLYKGKQALWSTRTQGAGVYAAMQTDGNFVLYQGGKSLWSSNTPYDPGASLVVQDDGNVVIYSTDQRALWSARS